MLQVVLKANLPAINPLPTGLNLTAADHVLLIDPLGNPGGGLSQILIHNGWNPNASNQKKRYLLAMVTSVRPQTCLICFLQTRFEFIEFIRNFP